MFVALGLGMEVTIVLASTPRRARSHLSAGVVAVLACTLAACDDGDTVSRTAPDVTDTTAPDVTDPAEGDEKVVVVFDGLTGAEGRTIVGVSTQSVRARSVGSGWTLTLVLLDELPLS